MDKSFKDTLIRGIALLGLILVLVLGAWGIIVLAFNAPHIVGSAGQSIASLFKREDTVEVPVVATSTDTTPAPSTTSGKTTTQGKPTSTYTPAATPVVQLYGLPDLMVRITSVVPQGNRYSAQFEISNVGTNVAAAGWVFTALVPLDPTYTFTSAPQQALSPGDKIVYTLGFDAPYNNYYSNDYRYPYNSSYKTNSVTVVVDPYLRIYEQNRYNNTASQALFYNYNTYYQTYPTYQYPYWY